MHLRPIWKNKKAYWVLLKSVRQGSKVRQEVVAYLGSSSRRALSRAQDLKRRLGVKADQPGLFDPLLEEEIGPDPAEGCGLGTSPAVRQRVSGHEALRDSGVGRIF